MKTKKNLAILILLLSSVATHRSVTATPVILEWVNTTPARDANIDSVNLITQITARLTVVNDAILRGPITNQRSDFGVFEWSTLGFGGRPSGWAGSIDIASSVDCPALGPFPAETRRPSFSNLGRNFAAAPSFGTGAFTGGINLTPIIPCDRSPSAPPEFRVVLADGFGFTQVNNFTGAGGAPRLSPDGFWRIVSNDSGQVPLPSSLLLTVLALLILTIQGKLRTK